MKISLPRFIASLGKILSRHPQVPASLEDNALLRTILQRRSVRQFAPRPIPEDVFAAILEAGRVAPSTVNLQTWSFAFFDAPAWREKFGRPIPFRAQRAVIVMSDTHRVKQVLDVFPYSPLLEYTLAVMNASLAAMNMTTAAEALGVASVMLSETGRTGLLDVSYLCEKLQLPPGVIPLTTIVFGYPAGPRPPMPPKLALQQVFFNGVYPPVDRPEMEDWLAQMVSGYKASHPTSSFDAQLAIYRSKISQAETDLEAIVFTQGRAEEKPNP